MSDSPRSRFHLPHWGWFLLATVVLVVGFAGLSVWLPYLREQHVIQKIERRQGSFTTETRGPAWMRKLVGEDRVKELRLFTRIDAVRLFGAEITDAEAIHLGELSNLRKLWLSDTAVTDASLAQLGGLKSLEELWLKRTKVTDAGLHHLSGLKNLKSLSLYATEVSDAGLVQLGNLTNLKFLYLHATNVTNTGVEELQKALPYCVIDY